MTENASVVEELRFVLRHPLVRSVLLAFLVLALALALFVGFFWWPVNLQEASLRDQVQRLRLRTESDNHARRIAQAVEAGQKDLKEARSRLAAATSPAELAGRTFGLAEESGLTVTGETNRARKLERGGKLFLQELTLRGRYPSFRQFFAALPGLPTWTVVHEVRMERREPEAQGVKATVTLGTLRRPQQDRSGGGSG